MHHDLTGLLSRVKLQEDQIKNLIRQMFEGLQYLHLKNIMHRDLKGSNLLINSKGELKLADFGLARTEFQTSRPKMEHYTNRVITLWYRSPELLLGSTKYDFTVDIWSAGCIFLEFYEGKPVFCGKDEISQLEKLWRMVGTPDPVTYPEVQDLAWWDMMRPASVYPSQLKETFRG